MVENFKDEELATWSPWPLVHPAAPSEYQSGSVQVGGDDTPLTSLRERPSSPPSRVERTLTITMAERNIPGEAGLNNCEGDGPRTEVTE